VTRRLALLLVLTACVVPGNASANGDPASDVLPFGDVFLSVQDPRGSAAGRELLALTADAARRKYPIKVAVIAQPSDLGLIQSLWEKPQPYANFLGNELVQFARYRGTLVVAMPQGFGIHGPGATAPGRSAVTALPKPNTGDFEQLGQATTVAVRRVAAANRHPLSPKSSGSGFPAWAIVLAALGGAAVVAGAGFAALRRWLLHG
jgi:hypothetical protein